MNNGDVTDMRNYCVEKLSESTKTEIDKEIVKSV